MQKVRGKEGEPRSNQVYLVAFMCSKFGTSFIFVMYSPFLTHQKINHRKGFVKSDSNLAL